MMTDDKILKALKALAEEDQGLQAGQAVAERLRVEFRARRRRRMLRSAAAWTLAAAAAGVIAVFFVARGPAKLPQAVPDVVPQIATPAPVATLQAPPAPPRVAGVRRKPTVIAAQNRPESYAPPQMVTDFYPLLDPAPPFERGQLLRVNLPASAMRAVGLPVHEDRLNDAVQADILLGEEGLPRAIRFVGFQVR